MKSSPVAGEAVTLHSTVGGSDKIYKLAISEASDGWIVSYANGRRGSTLTHGAKTAKPVAYEAARKIYDKVVREKLSGGYKILDSSEANPISNADIQAITGRVDSGRLPQLLNPISEEDLQGYLEDDSWIMQEKIFGERRMIEIKNRQAVGIARKGNVVALPEALVNSLLAWVRDDGVVLDGEIVGDAYRSFDLLACQFDSSSEMIDLTNRPFHERLFVLQDSMADLPARGLISLVRTAQSKREKLDLIREIQEEGGEGVVFKSANASYEPGRPARGGNQVKFKFYETLSAVVYRQNDQRSVAIELKDGDTNDWISVGNVTVPVNFPIPAVGEVVEVRYLHAYEGGSLYEPVYLGVRADVAPEECLASQRKIKPMPSSVEAGGLQIGLE